jgi:hypothetical protein
MRASANVNAIFSAGSALRRIVNEEVVDRRSASHDILTWGFKEMKAGLLKRRRPIEIVYSKFFSDVRTLLFWDLKPSLISHVLKDLQL